MKILGEGWVCNFFKFCLYGKNLGRRFGTSINAFKPPPPCALLYVHSSFAIILMVKPQTTTTNLISSQFPHGSTKSFENLIRILDKFTNISGLKLNAKKCQVLRIGSLTSKTIELMKHRKFSWNSNKASCLGMVFKTNREKSLSSNLEPKIIEFEKCLMQWRHRKLSLMGKIVVIKSYALPKLIYPLTSLPNPPNETIKRIEKMMYNFIWDGKPDKIKREILTSDYDKGGLRMIDIEKFIWSLKISWVKRILQTESNSLLKHLYENVFKQFGGNILFECNFREADIIKQFNKKNLSLEIYY